METRIKKRIENEYPYPIALEFRRLNTVEYLEPSGNRLKQLLKISESIIHLLSLISLVDLCDNYEKIKSQIPDTFVKEFNGRFTRTTFGKWIALLRESIKIFKESNVCMFIEELSDFFIIGKNSESEAQKAFNRLTTIRNSLAHPESTPSNAEIISLCTETEQLLYLILDRLDFIGNYPFLHVDNVSVRYPKWGQPAFQHTFAEVVGNTSEFNAFKKNQSSVSHTPALIICKEGTESYLNLFPVIIYTDCGDKQIPDVFLYIDYTKGKEVKYKPVWNGGELNIYGTKYEDEMLMALHKFFEFFADKEAYHKIIS